MRTLKIRVVGPQKDQIRDMSFSKFPVTIGRDAGLEVSLDESASSRMHARIEPRGAELWIVDLQSRNGIFDAKNKRITEAPIEDGLALRIGNTWLAFQFENPEDSDLSPFDTMGPGDETRAALLSDMDELPPPLSEQNFVEKIFQITQQRHVWAASLLLLAIASVASSPGNGLGALGLSLLSAAAISAVFCFVTWLLIRLFRERVSMKPYFRFYLVYSCLYSMLLQAATMWKVMHPDGNMLGGFLTALLTPLMFLVFLMNLRWIWQISDRKLKWGLGFGGLFTLLALVTQLQGTGPRWREVVRKADLVQPLVQVPTAKYLPIDGFMGEMNESLEILNPARAPASAPRTQ